MSDLTGRTVAIIATDFFEEPELVTPRDQLPEAGATVKIHSNTGDPIQAVQGDTEPTRKVEVDGTFDDLDLGTIDGLVVPGATWTDEEVVVDGNPITSRSPDDLPAFVRALEDVLS